MPSNTRISRRSILQALAGLGVGTQVFQRALAASVQASGKVTAEMVAQAEWIAGIELAEGQRDEVAAALENSMAAGRKLRSIPVDVDTVPSLVFRPDFYYAAAEDPIDPMQAGAGRPSSVQVAWEVRSDEPLEQSTEPDLDLAFASIGAQAGLLAKGGVSSRELTELYLGRLKKFDPQLQCVVTLLEEHALSQAEAADARRSRGITRGPLDGIPWVAKDLIAVPPWKTTWGAEPFREQVRGPVATVAQRLEASGAVLLAKVTLGALAWGDRWFGGMTRNPWNVEQGSSGSSAGSAAAVAAGLATFALGSETLGSIISPTRRCSTSGLRPTFGRVSRAGCMPLAWSMDKIGPIARHVEDLAFVFAAILGPDGRDPSVVHEPFVWPEPLPVKGLTVGLTGDRPSRVEAQALELLKSEGARVVEVDLSTELPLDSMNFILGVEATSVFEDAFRDDPMADYGLWGSTFRSSQLVPAIQYLRANRLRGELILETERKLRAVDVVLGGNDLLLTNLTGHPSLNVSCGTSNAGQKPRPGVVKLTAAAYRESRLLQVGALLQRLLPPLPSRPELT
jgi:Asp-tRNA(Asn)/Glu-tRNA(Gln) amidotransferase A subunit family amidase